MRVNWGVVLAILFFLGVVFFFILVVVSVINDGHSKTNFCNEKGGEISNIGSKCVFVDTDDKFVEEFSIRKVNGKYYLTKSK